MSPLFSIVTVCLNAGEALRRTVESVLAQKFEDFEYLIKDGGSTDGSLDSLPSDPRIRIVRSRDHGIFDAMNQALDAAAGRYVHFLNAGDLFVDNKVLVDVQTQIARSPDTEFFYGDVIFPGCHRKHVCYPNRLSRNFLFSRMLCHQGWFVLRKLYLKVGKFKLGAQIGCDQVFLYDAILGAGAAYKHVFRFVVRYDVHGVSSSRSLKVQSAGFREASRRHYYPAWERGVYRTIWRLRLFLRACLSLPPFLALFQRYHRFRFRKEKAQ